MRSDKTAFRKVAAGLSDGMTDLLAEVGFARRSHRQWARHCNWKLDLIELTALSSGVLVNFFVWIPCRTDKTGEEKYDCLGVEGLGHIVGLKYAELHPSWLQSKLHFAGTIIDSLRKGLRWYDQFENPEKCLNWLHGSDRVKTSEGYIDCERYLRSLLGGENANR